MFKPSNVRGSMSSAAEIGLYIAVKCTGSGRHKKNSDQPVNLEGCRPNVKHVRSHRAIQRRDVLRLTTSGAGPGCPQAWPAVSTHGAVAIVGRQAFHGRARVGVGEGRLARLPDSRVIPLPKANRRRPIPSIALLAILATAPTPRANSGRRSACFQSRVRPSTP